LPSERMAGTVVANSSVVEPGKALGLSREDTGPRMARRNT